MPKTCIATCVKNEGPYLLEWIAWNRIIGFDEIAIYDNGSNDSSPFLLGALSDAGVIRLHPAPDEAARSPQAVAFKAEAIRPGNEWLMLADPDEFLLLDAGTIGDLVSDAPPHVSQICFNWRLFGSSGHESASDEPVMLRFTKASEITHPVNRHVKAITRRQHIDITTIHAPILKGGLRAHDDMTPAYLENNGLSDRVSWARSRLNHYIVKSREEFDAKIARGRGSLPVGHPNKVRPDAEAFWIGHNANDVECNLDPELASNLIAEMERLSNVVIKDRSRSVQQLDDVSF